MSILFATPMFGGQCTAEFHLSVVALTQELTQARLPHDFLVTDNESLIQRARNTQAATFLDSPLTRDMQALMFIDADIAFAPDHVATLWNMNVPVACAAYPMKRDGGGVTAWKDGQLVDLDDLDGPTPVDYAGTGFLMIRREVFEQIREAHPEIEHTEGMPGGDGTRRVWAFFDTGVVDDGDGPYFISEDYHFSRTWRNLGGEIILDPSIRLGHVGRKVYR